MQTYPDLPTVDDAPAVLQQGHLWLQELVDGGHLRFQLHDSGVLRFGDRSRGFTADEVPLPYQHAVRHVQRSLDRSALRAAVPEVESVVFFGVATQKRSIEYDWARLPSFLRTDVWSADREGFLAPDTVDQIFERLGLAPVNTVAREVRAQDFDPKSYAMPESNWYDGPAARIVIRNKSGGRAKLPNPGISATDPVPVDGTAAELADEFAPRSRFEAVARWLEQQGRPVTFDDVRDRVLEGVFREHHQRLLHGQSDVAMAVFRREIAERTSQFLQSRS